MKPTSRKKTLIPHINMEKKLESPEGVGKKGVGMVEVLIL